MAKANALEIINGYEAKKLYDLRQEIKRLEAKMEVESVSQLRECVGNGNSRDENLALTTSEHATLLRIYDFKLKDLKLLLKQRPLIHQEIIDLLPSNVMDSEFDDSSGYATPSWHSTPRGQISPGSSFRNMTPRTPGSGKDFNNASLGSSSGSSCSTPTTDAEKKANWNALHLHQGRRSGIDKLKDVIHNCVTAIKPIRVRKDCLFYENIFNKMKLENSKYCTLFDVMSSFEEELSASPYLSNTNSKNIAGTFSTNK